MLLTNSIYDRCTFLILKVRITWLHLHHLAELRFNNLPLDFSSVLLRNSWESEESRDLNHHILLQIALGCFWDLYIVFPFPSYVFVKSMRSHGKRSRQSPRSRIFWCYFLSNVCRSRWKFLETSLLSWRSMSWRPCRHFPLWFSCLIVVNRFFGWNLPCEHGYFGTNCACLFPRKRENLEGG